MSFLSPQIARSTNSQQQSKEQYINIYRSKQNSQQLQPTLQPSSQPHIKINNNNCIEKQVKNLQGSQTQIQKPINQNIQNANNKQQYQSAPISNNQNPSELQQQGSQQILNQQQQIQITNEEASLQQLQKKYLTVRSVSDKQGKSINQLNNEINGNGQQQKPPNHLVNSQSKSQIQLNEFLALSHGSKAPVNGAERNFKKNFQNGIFQGCIRDGQMDGEGAFFWDSGSFYYGQWKKNKMEGLGIYIFPNGGLIKGYFKSNKVDGLAEIHFSNGDRYCGFWRQGFFNGKGLKYQKEKNKWVQKSYSNGQNALELGFPYQSLEEKTQEKILIEATNNKSYFDTILGANLSGYQEKDNIKMIGNLQDNLMNGIGTIIDKDGKLFIGNMKDSIIEGRGRIIFQSGDIYDGFLMESLFQGPGIYYNSEKNEWNYGIFSSNKAILIKQTNHGYPPPSLYQQRQKAAETEKSDALLVRKDLENIIIESEVVDSKIFYKNLVTKNKIIKQSMQEVCFVTNNNDNSLLSFTPFRNKTDMSDAPKAQQTEGQANDVKFKQYTQLAANENEVIPEQNQLQSNKKINKIQNLIQQTLNNQISSIYSQNKQKAIATSQQYFMQQGDKTPINDFSKQFIKQQQQKNQSNNIMDNNVFKTKQNRHVKTYSEIFQYQRNLQSKSSKHTRQNSTDNTNKGKFQFYAEDKYGLLSHSNREIQNHAVKTLLQQYQSSSNNSSSKCISKSRSHTPKYRAKSFKSNI